MSSTGFSEFVNGVGARVRWLTGGLHFGRRVVGTTFVVPLVAAAFEGAGNVKASYISTLGLAATALLNTPTEENYIWGRPKNGAGGAGFQVGAAEVPDAVSWLRSRRT